MPGCATGDVVLQSSSGSRSTSLAAILAIGKPVALDARADERDTRVHFDHDHPAVVRVDRELDVRTAGFHADFAQDGDGGVTQQLVFRSVRVWAGATVIESPVWMPMGSKFFDRANDDAVVRLVANHFHLVLFQPISDSSISSSLVGDRSIPRLQISEFFGVVGNAASGAAQREAGANDHGEARPPISAVMRFCTAQASSKVWQCPTWQSPDQSWSWLPELLAVFGLSIACSLAPIISTFVICPARHADRSRRSSAQFGHPWWARSHPDAFGDDALDHLPWDGLM